MPFMETQAASNGALTLTLRCTQCATVMGLLFYGYNYKSIRLGAEQSGRPVLLPTHQDSTTSCTIAFGDRAQVNYFVP